MQKLPDTLYKVDSVVRLEKLAIDEYGITAWELMQRAAAAAFNVLAGRYSREKKILVLCGAGNNASDGYVVARLAREAGYAVRIISLSNPANLQGVARQAYQYCCEQTADQQQTVFSAITVSENSDDFSCIDEADVFIDAILGTGLRRDVSVSWSAWIRRLNQAEKPVISLDVPSGLFADTGDIAGIAVNASLTVCFIALKQGMFTARGKEVCGEILFDGLALPPAVYELVQADARLIQGADYRLLPRRKASCNKGNFGHVLIVGGNDGMPGAVILAARAALRTGAGLVTIITIRQHLTAISAAVPEAMIKTCDEGSMAALFRQPFITRVTHVAIGMGLGQDQWSLDLLRHCLRLNRPMLIDADALNLIAAHDFSSADFAAISPLVITPHPGEAARLLAKTEGLSAADVTAADVQRDRFSAIKRLHRLFAVSTSCAVVLKGSGTLIFDGGDIKVCALGNAAMAAPGMGDVLSGMVIALMAQQLSTTETAAADIAELAVCLHAAAADRLVGDNSRGLLASDVIDGLAAVLR